MAKVKKVNIAVTYKLQEKNVLMDWLEEKKLKNVTFLNIWNNGEERQETVFQKIS